MINIVFYLADNCIRIQSKRFPENIHRTDRWHASRQTDVNARVRVCLKSRLCPFHFDMPVMFYVCVFYKNDLSVCVRIDHLHAHTSERWNYLKANESLLYMYYKIKWWLDQRGSKDCIVFNIRMQSIGRQWGRGSRRVCLRWNNLIG